MRRRQFIKAGGMGLAATAIAAPAIAQSRARTQMAHDGQLAEEPGYASTAAPNISPSASPR